MTSYTITSDSELVRNYLQSDVLDPQEKFLSRPPSRICSRSLRFSSTWTTLLAHHGQGNVAGGHFTTPPPIVEPRSPGGLPLAWPLPGRRHRDRGTDGPGYHRAGRLRSTRRPLCSEGTQLAGRAHPRVNRCDDGVRKPLAELVVGGSRSVERRHPLAGQGPSGS
jgi:hypothetical protein